MPQPRPHFKICGRTKNFQHLLKRKTLQAHQNIPPAIRPFSTFVGPPIQTFLSDGCNLSFLDNRLPKALRVVCEPPDVEIVIENFDGENNVTVRS